MVRFDNEEKLILKNIGIDVSKEIISEKDIEFVKGKLEELYTMYGFDDEEQLTSLGEIYENMLNKLGVEKFS